MPALGFSLVSYRERMREKQMVPAMHFKSSWWDCIWFCFTFHHWNHFPFPPVQVSSKLFQPWSIDPILILATVPVILGITAHYMNHGGSTLGWPITCWAEPHKLLYKQVQCLQLCYQESLTFNKWWRPWYQIYLLRMGVAVHQMAQLSGTWFILTLCW